MSIRKIPFASGQYFHIYNRGNSKQVIFKDKKDHDYFIKLLFLSNGRESFKIQQIKDDSVYNFNRGQPLVEIGVYSLMPNHFHLLITPTKEGSVSKFMQKLSTGYSMYFNKKYERTGTLFEGKFKSQHADNDRYLKYLFSYIHLNPLKIRFPDWKEKGFKNKTEAFNFLKGYSFSSYLDYLDSNRTQKCIINNTSFPKYFSTATSFKEELFDWLNFNLDH